MIHHSLAHTMMEDKKLHWAFRNWPFITSPQMLWLLWSVYHSILSPRLRIVPAVTLSTCRKSFGPSLKSKENLITRRVRLMASCFWTWPAKISSRWRSTMSRWRAWIDTALTWWRGSMSHSHQSCRHRVETTGGPYRLSMNWNRSSSMKPLN